MCIINNMQTLYTTAKFANYVHIHAYVFYAEFRDRIIERRLDRTDYQIDVNIDCNIAEFLFQSQNPLVMQTYKRFVGHLDFTSDLVQRAINKVARKNSFRVKLKDMDLLIRELEKIVFVKEKPKITDDSLESPAIDFIKIN